MKQNSQTEEIDIVFHWRDEGSGIFIGKSNAADLVRKQLYQLHYWHTDIKIADIGNVKAGVSAVERQLCALSQTSAGRITADEKTIVILWRFHDITLAQYAAHRKQPVIEATRIDAMIDLRGKPLPHGKFYWKCLPGNQNMVKALQSYGFQSYFIHPRMLETMDKLRFRFIVGIVKEDIEEMEPFREHTATEFRY